MAQLSKGVKLKMASEALTDMLSFPDLGGDTDQVETTTLDNANRTYIPGLKDYGDFEFEFNYEKTQYQKLDTAAKSNEASEWSIEFPTGESFAFSGVPSVRINGVGIGEVITYTLKISLSSDVTFSAGA